MAQQKQPMSERTRMILMLGIGMLVLFGWNPLMIKLGLLPEPQRQASTQPAIGGDPAAPSTDAATLPTATQPTVGAVTAAPLPAAIEPGKLVAATAPTTLPSAVAIGSGEKKDPQYAMRIAVSPQGGAITEVVLNDYQQSVESQAPFAFVKPDANGIGAFATRSITINGQKTDLTNSIWSIDSAVSSDRSVTVSLDVTDGQKPLVTLYKTIEILPRAEGGEDGPRGFEANVKYTFANRTDRPLTVSSVISGPTFPPSEQLQGHDRQVIGGYRATNTILLKHLATETFSGSGASVDYTMHEGHPLVWIGAGSNYFNAILRPTVQPGQPTWIRRTWAEALNPQVEDALKREVGISVETSDLTLAPGTQQDLTAKAFFGPRWRELLNNAYYANPAVGYNHTLEISGSCAFCTFQWLVNLLMALLGFFERLTWDWGVAIILLVFVVRALLHPITKRAQINMAKMQKFGPELERLKKKYANDKEALNRAMMQFYKQQGATPVLGCLPMFLQMPIWIALYSGLSTTFQLRLQPFFYDLTWIKDLAKPDHLIEFAPTTFLFFTIDGLNVLPILMAAAFWMQAKLQPKPPAMTPEQEQQQKMMQWMTLLFPVFLYSSPSGLNIYILTSTIFGIIENHIIRKHIKEREAREASGPVIVDAEVINAEDLPRNKKAEVAKPGGGLMGWFANLQERAEQLRQEAQRKAEEQQRRKKK